MTDDIQQGVPATEQPAAPSEEAQIVVDETAAVNPEPEAEQITESVVASEPVAAEEPEVIDASEFGGDDDTKIPFDKKAARKFFFQVNEMGGEPVFNALRGVGEDLLSGQPDGVRLANKINDLNPEAYQRLGSVLLESTIKSQFGEGVTYEQIAAALQRPAEQPEPEQTDEPTDDYVSPAVQAQLDELKELKAKFPELETKVGKYDQVIEQQAQQKVMEFGQTVVEKAMSPLGKLFEDAGLKILPDDSPEEVADKQRLASMIYRETYDAVYNANNNKAIVDETEAGIRSLNPLIAEKHLLKLQARVEKEGAAAIRAATGRRAQARNLQTKPLDNETAKAVPGVSGAAAFAQTADTTGPFDPDRASQVFQDIAARGN